ncbi:MAG TPA: substrate-binding domain-containing protein [Clostridiaceae bacterium]|nr:substrate-binding domain-containing protein [Clostridiaceae bacterium]
MKRIILLLMVLVLIVSFSACGTSQSPKEDTGKSTTENTTENKTEDATAGTSETDTAKTDDPLYFVYVSPLLSHPIWLIAKEGFEDACKELGIQGDWVGPQGISPEEMAQLVDTAVAQKADAIITQGLVPAKPVNDAIAAGIPVIVVDGDIAEAEGKLAFLGKDLKKQAKLLYDWVASKIPADTKIVYSIQCAALNAQVYIDQNKYIEEAFSQHPGGAELVNITTSEGDKMKGTTEWQNTFNTYPDINVAINVTADGAVSCARVAEEMGIQDKVLIFGVDDIQETLDLIRQDKIEGTIVTSFYNYGYQATYWLYQHITEGRVPEQKFNDAGTIIVTKENIDTYAEQLRQKVDLPPKK